MNTLDIYLSICLLWFVLLEPCGKMDLESDSPGGGGGVIVAMYLLLLGVEGEAFVQRAAELLDVLLLLAAHALRVLHHLLLDVPEQAVETPPQPFRPPLDHRPDPRPSDPLQTPVRP